MITAFTINRLAAVGTTAHVQPCKTPSWHRHPREVSIIDNPYYFTGRHLDTETGLYYYRARYYSPTLGRFLQTDPIGYEGGLNLYTYCSNNPIILVDPYGLCSSGYDWSGVFTGMGSAYVSDVKNYFVGIATAPGDYYHSFRGTGMGVAPSVLQAANMTVGRVVGYSTLAEGIEGVDVRSTTTLEWGGWSGRGARIGFGTLQTGAFASVAANALYAGGGGLTTPNKFFGTRTASQAEEALKAKYGPPTHMPPGKQVWFNSRSGRSIVIHNEAGHGAAHIDIVRRGAYAARKIPLLE